MGSDARNLTDSDLNPFLFARIGTELNGSDLTALSLLARLGSDPWAEAARLTALPRSAATDWLVERIGGMPLTARDLAEARPTAARLVLLLPARVALDTVMAGAKPGPAWALLAVILGLIAFGFALQTPRAPPPAPSAIGMTGQ